MTRFAQTVLDDLHGSYHDLENLEKELNFRIQGYEEDIRTGLLPDDAQIFTETENFADAIGAVMGWLENAIQELEEALPG